MYKYTRKEIVLCSDIYESFPLWEGEVDEWIIKVKSAESWNRKTAPFCSSSDLLWFAPGGVGQGLGRLLWAWATPTATRPNRLPPSSRPRSANSPPERTRSWDRCYKFWKKFRRKCGDFWLKLEPFV
jgi:hypothetical protein